MLYAKMHVTKELDRLSSQNRSTTFYKDKVYYLTRGWLLTTLSFVKMFLFFTCGLMTFCLPWI